MLPSIIVIFCFVNDHGKFIENKIEDCSYTVKLLVCVLTIKYFVSTWFILLASNYIYRMTSAKF